MLKVPTITARPSSLEPDITTIDANKNHQLMKNIKESDKG